MDLGARMVIIAALFTVQLYTGNSPYQMESDRDTYLNFGEMKKRDYRIELQNLSRYPGLGRFYRSTIKPEHRAGSKMNN